MSTLAVLFFNEHQDAIVNGVNRIVNKKVSEQYRPDVSQTALMRTFTSIVKTIEKGETIKNTEAFAYRIAQRAVADFYREGERLMDSNSFSVCFNDGVSCKSNSASNGLGEAESDSCNFFSVQSIDNGYGISEMRADYESHKDHFTPREQEVIDYLLYKDVYSAKVSEIATTLDINKSHASRAYSKLRKICN